MWKYRCSRFVERKKKQVKCKLLAFLNATGTHQLVYRDKKVVNHEIIICIENHKCHMCNYIIIYNLSFCILFSPVFIFISLCQLMKVIQIMSFLHNNH